MSDNQIYFVRPVGANGPTKIGTSCLPQSRLENLAVWSPIPLEVVCTIPGGYEVERRIHEAFADLHSHKEWFRADPRIDDLIAKLKSGVPLDAATDMTPRGYGLSKKATHYARNPEARLRCSYSHRLNWAEKKLPRGSMPDDITAIMRRWHGIRGFEHRAPSEADFSRLEAFIADPVGFVQMRLAA